MNEVGIVVITDNEQTQREPPHPPPKEDGQSKIDPLFRAILGNSDLDGYETERLKAYLEETGTKVAEADINNIAAIIPKVTHTIASVIDVLNDQTPFLSNETKWQKIRESINPFVSEILPSEGKSFSHSAIRAGCVFGVIAALHKKHQGQHYLSQVLIFANTLEGKNHSQKPFVIDNKDVMYGLMGKISNIETQINNSPDNPILNAINVQLDLKFPAIFTL